MYRVYCGSYLLHDLTIPEEEGYYLKTPLLTEEINKVAEFTFTIYDTHPNFDKLEKLVPNIIVKKDNKVIFKGRIIKEKQNMDNSKQVTCESVLAFLFDSVVRPYEFQGSPKELFTQFINIHNSQVEDYKKFIVGSTSGSTLDNNEYINRSNESYINPFDEITAKLLNIGGYFYVRYESDGNYIDWVDDFKTESGLIASSQIIEFGENLIDIIVENDGADVYSVIIPLGVETENEDGTKTRLTIEEINDGKDYLVNEIALSKYGWIVAPIENTTWDDVTLPENLKRKGQDLLDNQGVKFKSTLELKAIDLNVVDGEIDSFEMGEYIKAQSTPHNLSKLYLLTKKETPLTNPENMQITLGETKSTLTGMQLGDSQAIKNQINIIYKNYKLNEAETEQTLNNIRYEIETNTTLIQQTATDIRSEVSKEYVNNGTFDEYKNATSTLFEQTNDKFEMTFTNVVQQITNVDGKVNDNYNELVKYIRFNDGTITLGEVDNPLTLTLSNDRMSFLQNGVEVAYISDNKLYIYDAELINSLKIGRWVFIPRSNNNLSFTFI